LRQANPDISIWECNNLSVLHQYLQDTPGLVYTEFGSSIPGIPSEDLMGLSFSDDFFDLVLMTDVLEHVPDLDLALRELVRVLKSDGSIVLTVPVLMNRKTRQRAILDERGELKKTLEPSYHGAPGTSEDDMLVVHEFGHDVISVFKAYFDVAMYNEEELPFGANTVFVLRKCF